MTELHFPVVRRPEVSVVIVTYGQEEIARRSLQALIDHTEACYEVIVVDNGSTDGTPAFLCEVENATVVLNVKNCGFGPAANQGAAYGIGRHLLFLNSDAFVQPGWLAPLLERIDSDPGIGAVGPMLLNPEGTVQLAGALLTRSGSTAPYGQGDRPERPEYRFSRRVDYLSGACLLVRRAGFNEVGGFDSAYRTAYFEDADLCLALAERGYSSIYEPRSTVTHLRGSSGGNEALKLLALRNRGLFERRWRATLASRPLSPLDAAVRRVVAARDAMASARILVHGNALPPALVASLASLWPDIRVTLLGAKGTTEALFAAGVEVAGDGDDREALFCERPFHFDVVLVDQKYPLADYVTGTQPTAEVLDTSTVDSVEQLGDLLTRVGIAPPRLSLAPA